MLLLGTGMQTIDGVTVFPDHADEDQYWYLPAHLAIARRPSDDWPQFSFIKYKRAARDGGVEGGGFLMFTVELTIPEEIERKIRAKIPASARLTAVPFDSGTVECVALNLQGPGGTTATVSDAGTFVAVQQILGARVPSLFGSNQAVFSLTLSAEGATLLESAFAQGAAPIGVIYSLTFTAMQPSLDVRITADFERVYHHFSAGLSANVYYVEIAIQAGIEKLVQDGAITIEVTNYSTDADKQEQERAAIDFFTQHLLQAWFTPTLTPGTLQGGMASAPRAAGGAALFGPGSTGGDRGASPAGQPGRTGAASGRTAPPAPPPPAGTGATPPTPPSPPPGRGGTTPTPPSPPAGSGGTTPTPPSPGGTPARPASGGSGTSPTPAAPTPAPPSGQPTPTGTPAPAASTRDIFVHFIEVNGTDGVNGVYTVGYEADGTWHDTTTESGSSSQLLISVPQDWSGWISAQIRTLPELTMADVDQLRSHAASGSGILASGQRTAEPNQAMDELSIAPGSDDLSLTVRIPVTKTVVSAASPDALVAAVFPGGRLLQPGIYDCRRIPGTNNFELITPGWPGTWEAPAGGGQ